MSVGASRGETKITSSGVVGSQPKSSSYGANPVEAQTAVLIAKRACGRASSHLFGLSEVSDVSTDLSVRCALSTGLLLGL